MTPIDYEARIRRAADALQDAGVDALLVTNLTNVRYLCGFSGTNGQVLVTAAGGLFFTDPRYRARAADVVRGCEVVVYRSRLTEVVGDYLAAAGAEVVGIESETVTLSQHDDLVKRLPGYRLNATKGAVEKLRRSKDACEVELIRRAVEIGDAALQWIAGRLRPGVTERTVALELESWMRANGAEHVSFDPIVGSGPLSAHIHHTASDRELETGDLVLLDFGCRVEGYCSDLTRTVVLGRATSAQRDLYSLVLRAQLAALDALRPGALGADVDRAARAIIEDAGHGDAFGHGLGHGVGLDIHEAPRMHWESKDELDAGDVVTVEPGVYRAEPGGVRIEDCVAVTADGIDVLSAAPKDELTEV